MRKEPTIVLFGNRLAKRCQAMSKQRRSQCRNSVARGGSTVCRFHGFGGGPRTTEGRRRCAAAKTVHGNDTRLARKEYSAQLRKLYELEVLGRKIGLIAGPKTRGRRPG